MAAVRRRLAENRVVDADTVEGLDASDLVGSAIAIEAASGNAAVSPSGNREFAEASATCPEGYTVLGGGPTGWSGNPEEVWALLIDGPLFNPDGWRAHWRNRLW